MVVQSVINVVNKTSFVLAPPGRVVQMKALHTRSHAALSAIVVITFISFGTWQPVTRGTEPAGSVAPVPDPRHISNGWNFPSEGYADQPYIAETGDGAWL